jgi:LCP family protein required for cell wall assembly
MDINPMPRKRSNNGLNSVDGFVPNRRKRIVSESFKNGSTKKMSTANALKPRANTNNSQAHITETPAIKNTNAGVAWSSRLQDPSSVGLTRKTGRKNHRAKKNVSLGRNWRKIVKRSSLALVILILFISGYVGFKFFHNIDKVFGGNVISNISSLFGNTTLKGEDTGRVNILLAGDSADDPHHQGAQLTDSIMLVSINTKNNTGFMLSIPRDLYVNIPKLINVTGTSYSKINAANLVNNFNAPGYPSGGMGQLEQVVTQNLGIPINYNALINYSAMRNAVNAVGGITVNIQSNDSRGLFDPNIGKWEGGPLKLPNGNVTLNGQTALNLARARGDPCFCGQYEYGFPKSDFDRTQHQRQELIALTTKATSVGVLGNPVRVGQLFDSLGSNVATDLSLADVVKLAQLAKSANLTKAQSLSYSFGGTNPLLVGKVVGGQDVLVPSAGENDWSQLQLFYQKLTSNNPVVKESANVEVINGGNIIGLAKKWQTSLITKGINVSSIANTTTTYPATEIMDNSGGADPATKQLLESIFGTNIIPNDPLKNTSGAQFVVILGVNQGSPS